MQIYTQIKRILLLFKKIKDTCTGSGVVGQGCWRPFLKFKKKVLKNNIKNYVIEKIIFFKIIIYNSNHRHRLHHGFS